MTTEGYSSLLGNEIPQITTDEKFKFVIQNLINLKKVCSSIIDMYTTMHTVLVQQLSSQLNFDAKVYMTQLDNLLKDLLTKKERLEDEIYGVCRIEEPIVVGDIVKLIIDMNENGQVMSNRSVGGVYYIIGKEQLLPQIEAEVIGKRTGETFQVEIIENEKTVKYAVEVVGVKRRRGNNASEPK